MPKPRHRNLAGSPFTVPLAVAFLVLVVVAFVGSTHARLRGAQEATSAASGPGLSWAQGLRPRTQELALRAFRQALSRGQAVGSVVTIIDYELPSTAKRLWVLDLERQRVLFHELVAHGKGTGQNIARAFSNSPGSQQSSLGAFQTGATYTGKHGLSLRLHGLEAGINDNAETRAIVLHGAGYVSEKLARETGRLGRSHGCPAVRTSVVEPLIQTIRSGSFLFIYFPEASYERSSVYLKHATGR